MGATLGVVLSVDGSGSADCLKKTIQEIIRSADFQVHRPLEDYAGLLGHPFIKKLQSLGPDGHWIDMGAGEAKAVQQYLDPETWKVHESYARQDSSVYQQMSNRALFGRLWSDEKKTWQFLESLAVAGPRAHVTAVTQTHSGLNVLPHSVHHGKMKLLKGRFLEEIPVEDLTGRAGPADLITDVFGVFAYTHSPDLALSKYLEALKPDGEIHILFGTPRTGASHLQHHVVLSKTGKRMSLSEWMNQIPGIQASMEKTAGFGLPKSDVLVIRKTQPQIKPVSRLKLVEVVTEEQGKPLMPPRRIFQSHSRRSGVETLWMTG